MQYLLFMSVVNNCDNDKQGHATPFFTFILFEPVGKRAILSSNDKVSIYLFFKVSKCVKSFRISHIDHIVSQKSENIMQKVSISLQTNRSLCH